MDENDTPRRGRPRKVVHDADGGQSLPARVEDAHRDGAVSFVASHEPAPAPSRWVDLIAKINALAESGQYVTQVHTRDNRSGVYETLNGNAAMHGNAGDDFVVTSDGVKHPL